MLRVTMLAVASVAFAATDPPPRLDTARLPVGTETFRVVVYRGADSVAGGRQTETVTRVARGAVRMIARRVVTAIDGAMTVADTTETADQLPALRPLAHRATASGRRELLGFEPRRVLGLVGAPAAVAADTGGALPPGADLTRIDQPLPAGTVNSASLDLVLRAGPLDVGRTYALDAFSAAAGDVVNVRVTVAARETVDGIDCVRVETDVAGLPIAWWIDPVTRRVARQMIVRGRGVRIVLARSAPS